MDKVTETREQRLAGIRERAEELFDRQNPEDTLDEMFHGHEMIDFATAFADSERERVLLEAAKATCIFCRSSKPKFYEHYGLWVHDNKKRCRASDIWAIHDLRSKGESR